MFDLIRKTLLTGVGLAALTAQKAEELAKELKEKGKLTEKEGRELADELLKKSEEARKDLQGQVEKVVKDVLGKLDIPSRANLKKLEEKINSLKRRGGEKAKTNADS